MVLSDVMISLKAFANAAVNAVTHIAMRNASGPSRTDIIMQYQVSNYQYQLW